MTKAKGVFKYYQVIVRTKSPVSTELIEDMKRVVWELLGNISMGDIISRKVSKPHNLRWREGG